MQRRDFIALFGVVRVNQDGRLLARAEINVPGFGLLARDQIQAIAVSADAQRLWLTVRGELPDYEGHDGALIELSAFDASGAFSGERAAARRRHGQPSGAKRPSIQSILPARDWARCSTRGPALNAIRGRAA